MKIAVASPESEVVRPGARVGFGARIDHHRGLIIAISALLAMLAGWVSLSATPVGLYDIGSVISSATTLALAAIGQTIVVLSGGFDLSASAVVSLANVLAVRFVQGSPVEQWGGAALILAIGGGIGLVNGALIAWFRLQSIVVTLATMFMVQGLTLLIQNKPGGSVGDQFGAVLTADLIPDKMPMSAGLLILALLIWSFIKRTRYGVGLYALGSDADGAYANGMPVTRYRIATYALAGMFYAAAGLYVSAQTGSADPLVGRPLLLSMFTAVVLGGTLLGGGRGGCVGTVFAAMTLMITVNILLVLNVSAFFTTIAEAVILILAVLGSSIGKQSAAHECARHAAQWLKAVRTGTRARDDKHARRVAFEVDDYRPVENTELKGRPIADWIERNREWVKYVVPAYLLFFAVVVITGFVYGPGVLVSANFYSSLLTLTLFLAILGLGQGAVILTGGLDLSMPWLITLSGVLLTGLTHGVNGAAAWAVPMVLLVGLLVGVFNGVGVVMLGLPPIVVTLAANGLLQGLTLIYCNGSPQGWSPSTISEFTNGRFGPLSIAAWSVPVFLVIALLLLHRTPFGRRVYAVGNSPVAAKLSGVRVGTTLIAVYCLSGLCSAIVGLLLAGFSSQAFLGMGDPYLLPSIAVVVVGGALITGGRGHYLGVFGGALLLTALGTLLAGTTVPPAVRDIINGLVVLAAVITLRDKKG
ncbi:MULTISPECIES: ABC transporter permease [Caballeronia]|jgi:ribose transport system permease protein|uniref:ABC transporter permease n=1 Tax=Caballeronia zhejiangensis TaxID=871203 RepID=A0A656QDG2_9BURK|nr:MULTISPECIES: ABC transporter permease [Caballeronia]EKS67495.1 inner-membrane translocator [Burkholderia sp. SJ98]KDR26733.1 ABC transporter permease [Caballeronia zhejiangensis]MDR5768267.1 ABC transporter permease [Caballeronia sp. LZ028]MDR5789220.1 ABC transporter permease [Caballeronia sp. LP003]MDR5796913.1 ABC transporter permease [Caballeronia sp. LZ008]